MPCSKNIMSQLVQQIQGRDIENSTPIRDVSIFISKITEAMKEHHDFDYRINHTVSRSDSFRGETGIRLEASLEYDLSFKGHYAPFSLNYAEIRRFSPDENVSLKEINENFVNQLKVELEKKGIISLEDAVSNPSSRDELNGHIYIEAP